MKWQSGIFVFYRHVLHDQVIEEGKKNTFTAAKTMLYYL